MKQYKDDVRHYSLYAPMPQLTWEEMKRNEREYLRWLPYREWKRIWRNER